MPTYEYECKNCSHSFEVFQSMNDSPLTNCPRCGSEVRRLIFGGVGVIFKGSGFYVTDKNKNTAAVSGKNNAGADKNPASDTKSKESAAQSTPAVPPASCSECPGKGASLACP